MLLRALKTTWRQWFPPLPPTKHVILFLVRTGQYPMFGGMLTSVGQRQAHQAAAAIRRRTQDNPVLMIACDKRSPGHYIETARILTGDLGAPTAPHDWGVWQLLREGFTGIDRFHRDGLSFLRSDMWAGMTRRERRAAEEAPELRVVMVVDGSRLNDLLRTYPGPEVTGGNELGPPHGSVHELVVAYDRRTGAITDRRFVAEPTTTSA